MNAVALAFDDVGVGPPVVVLHGLFGAARNWQSVARELSTSHRVITVDLRNHGRSPHTQAMDYTLLAADVRALIETLGLEDVTLLGHSMGGKTAMTVALLDPARITRLIVVDITPVPSADIHTPMIDAMLAVPLDRVRRRSEVDAQIRHAVPEAEIRLFLLQNLHITDTDVRWRFNLPALRAGMSALVGPLPVPAGARFAGPSSFIRGMRSDRVLPEHVPLLRRLFVNPAIHSIEDAGHWPHAESPATFLRAVRDCLLA